MNVSDSIHRRVVLTDNPPYHGPMPQVPVDKTQLANG